MSSSLSKLETLVIKGLGGRNDATALTIIDACINYATTLASLLFKPRELEKQANQTLGTGTTSAALSLTNWLDIETIYNTSDSIKMWFIPWEQWYVVLPANIGAVKYFSLVGSNLWYKDSPSANKGIQITYIGYPTELANSNDTLDFGQHDSYIVSTAVSLAWSFFEKGRGWSDIEKALNSISLPLTMGTKARQLVEGRKTTLEALFSEREG